MTARHARHHGSGCHLQREMGEEGREEERENQVSITIGYRKLCEASKVNSHQNKTNSLYPFWEIWQKLWGGISLIKTG